MIRRIQTGLLLGLVMMFAGGCAGYQLQGKVVEGSTPTVLVLDQDDPRLDGPGLAGAGVTLTLDPGRFSQTRAGTVTTDDQGHFAVGVDSVGAGVFEYEARVDAWSSGHQTVRDIFPLPPSGRRVLITLPRGQGSQPTTGGDVLEETLRMGEQHMN
ncbi:MAG: hypothetical protein ACOCTI_07065 [Phycisphaeraceae bacterium]